MENKEAILVLEGIDMILGINVIILTDDKAKAELLNFYFAFIIYAKEKDWLERIEQIMRWENWRPRQKGRTTKNPVLNVLESLPAIVWNLQGTV